jgi:hypothetical protein
VAKGGIVAAVKTPEERGHPASQWAVDARAALGLSDGQVVELLGKYDESTLRKAEGHSDHLSRPMWAMLVELYQRLALERGIVLRPAPSFHGRLTPPPDGDLAAAVREQTRVMAELVAELQAARQAPQPDLAEVVARSVEAALLAAGVREASSSLSRSVAPQRDPV